jgi:hypothetical protein
MVEVSAMDETVLEWTVENWITVVLMASIGFAIIGLVQSWVKGKQGN